MKKIKTEIKESKAPMTTRSLYFYFQVPFNRSMMLDKIENGLKSEYKNLPELDKTEDEISKDVLTNWRILDKKSRLEYCQYIVDNSVLGSIWAYQNVEYLKQKFKDKIISIKQGLNPFKNR